jgi:hypothetical protein
MLADCAYHADGRRRRKDQKKDVTPLRIVHRPPPATIN